MRPRDRGVELALQSSINPKPLLERATRTTDRAGDLVVDECMVGYNVKRGDERRLSMGAASSPDDSHLDAARQMSDAVIDRALKVRDSIRARHTAAREVSALWSGLG